MSDLTLIAMPYVSKDGFSGGMVRSLIRGFASGNFGNAQFLFLADKTQVRARNDACRAAIDSGAEWLWFLDSDQDFPVDALLRLKLIGADVACPDMWSRSWPSYRIVFSEDGTPVPDEIASLGRVEEISSCGMGCTLINVSLLRKMADHYKDQPWFWSAHHGEDATFCFNAREIGASIKCDFGMKSGHWGHCRMTGQEFTRGQESAEHGRLPFATSG